MSAKLTAEERARIQALWGDRDSVKRLLASDAERERDCKELLVCLKVLVQIWKAGHFPYEEPGIWYLAWTGAEKAIAKAEGRE